MNRIVVITGGTSGIGLEMKKNFEADGDTVLTISTRNLDEENHYSASVSDENRMQEVINEIGKKYGRIDILVANAGFGMSGITELITSSDIQNLTEVNYYGTLYTIRPALKYMRGGSRIVTVASAMALFPVPFRSIYGSVKSAVLTLSFALRMELKPLGIDVVSFCPGDIKTNFTSNRIKDFNTDERYGTRLESATLKSDSREEKRIPADVCARKMYLLSIKKKTKPFYIIGGKYKLLYFLTKITPKSWLLAITNKLYGGK
ncbi:MAG: SDR family NAD(P)-dependent oxidoreductase [Clostridiales bacterium]|nr:SDR family NAD(P)-dependent oxidoreductase [Clostridiales bacterium]